MSIYTDGFVRQVLAAAAAARADIPPNPVQATVTGASIDANGVRTILVGFAGATDIPTMWSSSFDMAIQVITNGNLSKLVGTPVMVVTSSSPPYIDDLIVRS